MQLKRSGRDLAVLLAGRSWGGKTDVKRAGWCQSVEIRDGNQVDFPELGSEWHCRSQDGGNAERKEVQLLVL